MVLDSSALVAILMKADGHKDLLRKVLGAEINVMGFPTLLETTMVLSSKLGYDARPKVTDLLKELQCELIPFGERHFSAAIGAFLRYGRGRHPAALNFGDCMSYAVAEIAEMPLLFVGDDFSQTDLA